MSERLKDILHILAARFGPIPPDVESALQTIRDEAKLDDLINWACSCPHLAEFRRRLE